jgi:hypothetical protein
MVWNLNIYNFVVGFIKDFIGFMGMIIMFFRICIIKVGQKNFGSKEPIVLQEKL